MIATACRRAFVATLALLAFSRTGRAAPIEGTPVAPTMVHGNTLVIDDAGLSIEAPGTGWRWLETPFPNPFDDSRLKASMYLCQNSMNDAQLPYFFLVVKGPVGELTPKIVDKFVQGVKTGSGHSGMIFARPETKASGIPFAGKSYRYRY